LNTLLLKLLAGRLIVGVLSLLAVAVVVFTITALLPGDAAEEKLGQEATPEALKALRAQMGLDVPRRCASASGCRDSSAAIRHLDRHRACR
jgi:peptide/nickel transport system permease protein